MTNNVSNDEQPTGLSRFRQSIRREFVDNPIATTGAVIGIAIGCLVLCAAAWAARSTLGLVIIPSVAVVLEVWLLTRMFRRAARSHSEAFRVDLAVTASFVAASTIAISFACFLTAKMRGMQSKILTFLPESEELADYLDAQQQWVFSPGLWVYLGILLMALSFYTVGAYLIISHRSARENNAHDRSQSEGGDSECL